MPEALSCWAKLKAKTKESDLFQRTKLMPIFLFADFLFRENYGISEGLSMNFGTGLDKDVFRQCP
jgi:hypothetical protein